VKDSPKKKNNHFVPRSYLRRFCSASERQIGLYNIRSDRELEGAPIKSQCSRDYFYTKDPAHEDRFSEIEAEQVRLLNEITASFALPPAGSDDRKLLDTCLMFQAGRTASAVAHSNHMANEFGKAMLYHHYARSEQKDILEFLPRVKISVVNAVFDSIRQHVLMTPLVEDLDCTLLVNRTGEDFLTSDHPVVQCNCLPMSSYPDRGIGFASRGLIVLYPISPRAILLWSDAEVYRVASEGGVLAVSNARDVIDLNLAQFMGADENVYFSERRRVQETINAFRRNAATLRPPRPRIKDLPVITSDNRSGKLLLMERPQPRLAKPRGIAIRLAAAKGRFRLGDRLVRDPMRASFVKGAMDEFERRDGPGHTTIDILS